MRDWPKWVCAASGSGLVGNSAFEILKWIYKGVKAAAGGPPMVSLTWNVWLGLVLLAVFVVMSIYPPIKRWWDRPSAGLLAGYAKVEADRKFEALAAALETRFQQHLVQIAEQAAELAGVKERLSQIEAHDD